MTDVNSQMVEILSASLIVDMSRVHLKSSGLVAMNTTRLYDLHEYSSSAFAFESSLRSKPKLMLR